MNDKGLLLLPSSFWTPNELIMIALCASRVTTANMAVCSFEELIVLEAWGGERLQLLLVSL
jgi:hypothetical protein